MGRGVPIRFMVTVALVTGAFSAIAIISTIALALGLP
jgi:hypothetical protein